MTFHAFTEYLKYRWKAKSRHGIHSPFVYSFIDECLLVSGAPLRERIHVYFKAEPVITITDNPQRWQDLLDAQLNNLDKERILLVEDIHRTGIHTKAWSDLIQNDKVLLSIDLYNIGLLFFKEEFKIKQHFVLKSIE